MVTKIKYTNTRTGKEEEPTVTMPTNGSVSVWKHKTLGGHDGGAGSYQIIDLDEIGTIIEESFRPPDPDKLPQGAKAIPLLPGQSHDLFVCIESSSPQRVKVTVSNESTGVNRGNP